MKNNVFVLIVINVLYILQRERTANSKYLQFKLRKQSILIRSRKHLVGASIVHSHKPNKLCQVIF